MAARLPVPDALPTRLVRQAALVDCELTCSLLRSQLLQRALLFAPAPAGPPQRAALQRLTDGFEASLAALAASFAPK